MESNKIIERYNSLPEYVQKKVRSPINDLCTANEESRNYCIKVCPKCGTVEPGFVKVGF